MKVSTLIVDDEPAARRRLRSLLGTDHEVDIVGECGDGVRAAQMIRNLTPDLLFLDVQIPGPDGFGVLDEVADCPALPTVILVTAHSQYAIPAFEAQVLDYLLKPFRRSRFFEVLARAKGQIRLVTENRAQQSLDQPVTAHPQAQLLLIKSAGRLLFLKMPELKWITAERDYLRLHLDNENHFIRETMQGLAKRLDKNSFLRIHRSTIVNVNEISEILPLLGGDYTVILRDKTVLTLSRRYRSSLDDFLRNKLVSLPRSI